MITNKTIHEIAYRLNENDDWMDTFNAGFRMGCLSDSFDPIAEQIQQAQIEILVKMKERASVGGYLMATNNFIRELGGEV